MYVLIKSGTSFGYNTSYIIVGIGSISLKDPLSIEDKFSV